MAEQQETQKETEKPAQASAETPEKAKVSAPAGGVIGWVLPIVVAVCLGAGGFLAGKFVGIAHSAPPAEEKTVKQAKHSGHDKKTEHSAGHGSAKKESSGHGKKSENQTSAPAANKEWYYNLEPVVASLNEPGVMRYARAGITLEMNAALDPDEGKALLDEKLPVLNSWLTIYLASLTLDDVRGERNLRRMQNQILDAFNEKVFSGTTPQIKSVLLREFAVQ